MAMLANTDKNPSAYERSALKPNDFNFLNIAKPTVCEIDDGFVVVNLALVLVNPAVGGDVS